MDKNELLKAMITNIIDDNNEEAAVDFHRYLRDKMISASKGETSDDPTSDPVIDPIVDPVTDPVTDPVVPATATGSVAPAPVADPTGV